MDLTSAENINKALQVDEIEALSSIYGDEWVLEDPIDNVYSINITSSSGKIVYFQIVLPNTYPLQSSPTYRISAPWMSRDAKNRLGCDLDEICFNNIGESILYEWILKVQDFVEVLTGSLDNFFAFEDRLFGATVSTQVEPNNFNDEIPLIQHGEAIMDRKSVFQAHIAKVVSIEQVKQVLQKLKENKKISGATHNIFAYRIALENEAFIHDCDDDGENKAGSVLLHLLQVLDVSDVLVVVSRWYGGIHLGADRFKHISNAARSLLCDSGLVTKKDDSSSKKSKNSTR